MKVQLISFNINDVLCYVLLCQSRDRCPCGVCNKNIVPDAIECCLCKMWIHFKSERSNNSDLKYFEGDAHWIFGRVLKVMKNLCQR